MDRRFSKQTILISGATSGLGEAAARAFLAEGGQVFGLGRRREAVDAAAARTPGVRWVLADLRRPEEVRRAVEAVGSAAGRLDVLVNNAGVLAPAPLELATPGQLELQLATNLAGAVHLTQAALPLLQAAAGAVVNVSSAAGGKAAPGLSLYAATKAALNSLTRSWALELAPSRVRVNALAPGPTDTGALERGGLPPEAVAALQRQLVASVPLGRVASPAEVAAWILNLADAPWMTGQVLGLDGGMSLT